MDRERCEEFGYSLALVTFYMYALGMVMLMVFDYLKEYLQEIFGVSFTINTYIAFIGVVLITGGAYLGEFLLKRIYRKYKDLIKCGEI